MNQFRESEKFVAVVIDETESKVAHIVVSM